MRIKNKKGVSLIWALVIGSTLIIISTSLANTVIKGLQNGVRVEDSSAAYAAARSGIEMGKLGLKDWKRLHLSDSTYYNDPYTDTCADGVTTGCHLFAFSNDTQVYVKIHFQTTDKQWVITSIGFKGDVARELQYKIISNPPWTFTFPSTSINASTTSLKSDVSVSGSFSEKFAMWFPSSTIPSQFNFGLGQTFKNGVNAVWMKLVANDTTNCNSYAVKTSLQLKVNNPNGTLTSKAICLPNLGDFVDAKGSNKRLYVTINYINNVAVQMSLSSYDFVTYTPIDTVSLTLDPSFQNFSSTYLKNIYQYFSDAGGSTSDTVTAINGDGGLTGEFAIGNTKVDISSLQIAN